jgi:hypothetical protein
MRKRQHPVGTGKPVARQSKLNRTFARVTAKEWWFSPQDGLIWPILAIRSGNLEYQPSLTVSFFHKWAI